MIERRGPYWTASILNQCKLHSKAEDRNIEEPSIVAEVLENVEFAFAKLTGVDLVK